MEIVDHTGDQAHPHAWLEKLGLAEAPPGPDAWVPLVRALEIDDSESGASSVAARLIAALQRAGIQAQQHPYKVDGPRRGTRGIPDGMVARVAVLVRHRDLTRATDVAVEVQRELARGHQRDQDSRAVPDEELAQEALEAGPPPEV